jgi:aspartyl/asparaginyl beta-hydroxylase (cupin superfamily)
MNKVSENFNFKNHGTYDVNKIKSYILDLEDEWFINTSRQDKFYTHKDTNSYFMYQSDLKWTKDQIFSVEAKIDDEELLWLIEPIIEDLERIHNGVRGNVLFIKLKAKHNIPKHFDDGDYLVYSRRHHVPIITSEQTLFGVGTEKINMLEGECWEINNTRFHSVENDSDIDRVHLLIDIMPNNEIGK